VSEHGKIGLETWIETLNQVVVFEIVDGWEIPVVFGLGGFQNPHWNSY
jgi:hypothetical protein